MNTQEIWRFKDVNFSKDRGSVFSCFACCGGSTMGYKLAGFDVVGCNEIDPEVFKIYNLNHKPRLPFVMSIRDMLTQKTLPKELFNLDILDGSPPCTSFSTAGVRERDWGKEKRFSEGQALQRLDDLFFEFIALAQRLQPKIVVAENVAGMIKGKARGYIKEIVQAYDKAGYTTQLFRLNGANMGICQARDRVFFLSVRKDLKLPKINLQFNEKLIAFLQVEKWIAEFQDEYRPCTNEELDLLKKCKEGKSLSSVHPKGHRYTYMKIARHKPIPTIISGNNHFHYEKLRPLSTNEYLACSSFPIDYKWNNWKHPKKRWAMGMSVPPFMIERIANEIYRQWLSVL